MIEKISLTIIVGTIGVIIGFLAQRSRMCFVAGLRDYILVRDKELLLGLFSFVATIWFLTSIFYATNLLKQNIPEYGRIEAKSLLPQVIVSDEWIKNIQQAKIIGGAGEPSVSFSALVNRFFYMSLFGGCLIGIVSVFAGGCVLRQHVLGAQGNQNALFYIFGFYCAVVIYYLFLFKPFSWFYQ